MPTSVRELCLAGVQTELLAINEIAGLVVYRNEDQEIEEFPALNQVDAVSDERVLERGGGIEIYALDLVVEGVISASSPSLIGPALSEIIAYTRRAAGAAEASTAAIDQVIVGDCGTELVTEDDVSPHAFFTLAVEIRFGTLPNDPFTKA